MNESMDSRRNKKSHMYLSISFDSKIAKICYCVSYGNYLNILLNQNNFPHIFEIIDFNLRLDAKSVNE